MDSEFDLIVIGAGIIGSACAYYADKSGLKTLLLEQFELGHKHGSSHGASRIIRHTHSSEIYLPLSIDAYSEWHQLEKEFKHQLYRRNGLLWLSDDIKSTLKRAELLEKYHVPHKILKGRQIPEHFELLHYDSNGKWSAVWEPSGGTILADVCLTSFHEYLKNSATCTIRQNERVTNIDANDKQQVHVHTISGHIFTSKKLVIAAGPWLKKLVPDLPLNASPQRVAVNYWNIAESAQKKFQIEQESPNLIITQHTDGFETFMIPCADYPDKVKFGLHLGLGECDPDIPSDSNPEIVSSFNRILSNHIAEHITNLDASKPAIEDRCFYTMTDDNDFILDVHPIYINVLIAGGMSGTGFKFAPTIGQLIARAVLNAKNGIAPSFHEAFKLSRRISTHEICKL